MKAQDDSGKPYVHVGKSTVDDAWIVYVSLAETKGKTVRILVDDPEQGEGALSRASWGEDS